MTVDVLSTLAIVVGVLVVLATTQISADLVLVAAMLLTCLLGILSPEQALAGFGNPGVITVAALFVVVAGLRETGAIAWVSQRVLGHPKGVISGQLRLIAATAPLSAFVNNTPVVAMFIPVAQDWSARLGLPVSKLLMPMNHVVILAGMCTLMGTSTNVVVNGLLIAHAPDNQFGLFDLVWVGVPVTLLGVVYVLAVGRWLLPDRQGALEQFQNAREYSFEIRITPNGPLVGRTVAQCGFRRMRMAYLLEIERNGRLMTAVGPDEVLQGGDLLTFVGVVDAIRDLRRIKGLTIAEEQSYSLDIHHSQRTLFELVLSGSSPAAGKSVRDAGFRSLYGAAILSISRDGKRLSGKIGDVILHPGDTLLVEAAAEFAARNRYNRDFLLIRKLHNSTPPDFSRAPVALAILGLLVAGAALDFVSLFEGALAGAGLMVLTRCVSIPVARESIDYSIVLGIAASFALGAALMESGAAAIIAGQISHFSQSDPFLTLCAVYVVSVLLTELITNNAAGVLMFPIALAAAEQANASFVPFVIAVMIGASAGFITPIGYQTNLMIYGPGGYKFSDYIRFGVPLSILVGIAAVMIIPRIWPF